jgi:hypothetical protein
MNICKSKIFISTKLLYFIKYNMTGEGPNKNTRAKLKSFAKKAKKHTGGNHTSDHLPQVTGVEESWNLVNNLLNQSAPIDLGPPRQVGGKSKKKTYSLWGGGEEASGATFLPAQWTNPKAPLPRGNNANQMESAYGRINAVSGFDQNLAAFPGSSMQQTGGGKKGKKGKKAAKKATEEKPTKKAKKSTESSKKSTSLWAKIKSFF